jgi:hypothetical protein
LFTPITKVNWELYVFVVAALRTARVEFIWSL